MALPTMRDRYKGNMFRHIYFVDDSERLGFVEFLYHRDVELAVDYLAQWDDGDAHEDFVNYDTLVEKCGRGLFTWEKDYVLFRQEGGLCYDFYFIEHLEFYDITYEEIAEILMKNPNKTLSFTLETAQEAYLDNGEPSGWYGVKFVCEFDCMHGTLLYGYFGGDGHEAIPMGTYMQNEDRWDWDERRITAEEALQDRIRSMGKALKQSLQSTESYDKPTVCTDWGMEKHKILFCPWNRDGGDALNALL